jgi:hypothetical protein
MWKAYLSYSGCYVNEVDNVVNGMEEVVIMNYLVHLLLSLFDEPMTPPSDFKLCKGFIG